MSNRTDILILIVIGAIFGVLGAFRSLDATDMLTFTLSAGLVLLGVLFAFFGLLKTINEEE
jgi:Na+/proline symporter